VAVDALPALRRKPFSLQLGDALDLAHERRSRLRHSSTYGTSSSSRSTSSCSMAATSASQSKRSAACSSAGVVRTSYPFISALSNASNTMALRTSLMSEVLHPLYRSASYLLMGPTYAIFVDGPLEPDIFSRPSLQPLSHARLLVKVCAQKRFHSVSLRTR